MSLCLVTGGAGFIGSHVVRRLLELGHAVRVLDDFSTGRRENLAEVESRIELIEGDICDRATAEATAKGAEVVFHLAARASVPRSVKFPREANEANVTGTLNLLLAARDAGTRRFVYSASSSAYGETPTLPKVEDMAPQPLSPYAVSKLTAEYYCRCFTHVYGLETVSLRYFNVFGPRQDPNSAYAAVIPAFVSRMIHGKRPIVFGDGEQSRDFCYIENVVSANMLAMQAERTTGETVNIACGERTTLNRMIALINQQLGTSIEPEYQDPRPGDVRHSLADISAAERVIGYKPLVMFEEGLTRSIDWYRQNLR
jgi:nucleoside-diphosphate-sugar epimerase